MEQEVLNKMKSDLEAAVAAKVEELETPMTFYSANGCANLILTISSGRMVEVAAGRVDRIGEKSAEFAALPSGTKQPDGSVKYYGYYATTDPETALFLLNNGYFKNKFGQIKGDVLLPADYYLSVTPPSELLRLETARLLSTQNELQSYLSKQDNLTDENRRLREQLAVLAAKGGKPLAASA